MEIFNYFYLIITFISFLNFICVCRSVCSDESPDSADFVIVGGGTAGCILANRLSKCEKFTVALLEAGGEPPLASVIPRVALSMLETEVDWNYTTVPQVNALLSYKNQVGSIPRGKMLGGSGSINEMNFFRGNRLDFDGWEENGAKHWGWKHVFKYFKKIENDSEVGVNRNYHGHCGPICITNPGKDSSLVNSFLHVVKNMGYTSRDPNGDGRQTGYSYMPVNVCNNQRQSTYTNYLKPVVSRKNLKVKTFAFVERILFDKNKRANTVVYSKDGCRRYINVKKEVIVSSGVINSPQLLMLSGIGPRSHLESLNISVVSDLPVGENLHDHLRLDFAFTKSFEDIYNKETIQQFFEGKGPLVKFSWGNSFINTRYSDNHFYPDIQMMVASYSPPVNIGESMKYYLMPINCRPKSRGFLRLYSSNPYEYPLIDPRYFREEEDVEILAAGAKVAYSVMQSMNASELGFTPMEISVPACDSIDKNKDEYWRCVVKNKAYTAFHVCCTCRMGSRGSKTSVVDPRLKVIGVENVRVVDASVMPSLPSANPQATVMMIAKRGAEFVIEDNMI